MAKIAPLPAHKQTIETAVIRTGHVTDMSMMLYSQGKNDDVSMRFCERI